MGTAVIVTSGKGGTGKTTTAAAVASILAALGHRTLCFDADIGLRNLDIVLGLADRAVKDFGDVIDGRCSLEDAAVEHPDIKNLFLLTAPAYVTVEEIDAEKLSALMREIRERYDYCIIDSPAGIGSGFRLAASLADRALIVACLSAPGLRDAQRVAGELERLGVQTMHLIVNRVRPRLLRRQRATVDDAIDAAGIPLIGIVPEDDDVTVSGDAGVPLILYSSREAARAFLHISKRVEGKSTPLLRIKNR